MTWDDYLKDKSSMIEVFPGHVMCRMYMLVSKYPKAYEPDMGIAKAYSEAGKWKKNAGNPPLPTKVSVDGRLIASTPPMQNDSVSFWVDVH